MTQPGEAPACVQCGCHRDANVHIYPHFIRHHQYQPMSYYKFEEKQEVKVLANQHDNYVDRKGRVLKRRAGKDCAEYLVKLQGKSGPVSFSETELAITFPSLP